MQGETIEVAKQIMKRAMYNLSARASRVQEVAGKVATTEPVTLLEDLIGSTAHLEKEERLIDARGGKELWSVRFVRPDIPIKGTIVGLHGGPSFAHNYILPLKLLANDGWAVILYDQVGCGRSSFVADPVQSAPWLLTLEYYLEELRLVLAQWGVSSHYLYGSSWGTIMAQEYAVRLEEEGKESPKLLGLILDGALASDKLYIETQWRDRISTLPTYTQRLLRKLTDEKQFDCPVYEYLDDELSKHFTCRLLPPCEAYLDSIQLCNQTIYSKMQGESEFTVGGVLLGWNIADRLHKILVPCLVLVGEYDTMTVECSQQVVDNIPNCDPLVIVPRTSHCKLLEEPELCIQHMLSFLSKSSQI